MTVVAFTATSAPAGAAPTWAPADSAANVYLGYAAHCAGTGAATDTNGCDAGSLPLGTEVESAEGGSLGTSGGGWTHSVYTVTPGVPGDSGSAFLDADGNALGTVSTLAIAPVAGSNGVSDLSRELSFARARSGISGLQLATGTEPFSPIL